MKKLIATVIFCLVISVSAFAQSPIAELDKIKQITLLESTREDVKRIFRDYKKDADTEDSEDKEDSGDYEEEEVEGSDPTDFLIYNYTVSGGKIIGTGDKVTWSLSGVKPGRYTITAGVDAGGGARGTTQTEEVIVKECADCKQKPK